MSMYCANAATPLFQLGKNKHALHLQYIYINKINLGLIF